MNDIPLIRRFARGDRVYVQAQQIWLILVSLVMTSDRNPKKPKKIKYGDLAVLMGYPDKRAGHVLGRQLGIVGHYCVRNRLPALTAMVVAAGSGEPGDEVVTRSGDVWVD